MTKQRINEIKRKTVVKATSEIEEINFEDSYTACLKVGMIMGELSKNLEHELYKEMNFRNRINNQVNSQKRGDENGYKANREND